MIKCQQLGLVTSIGVSNYGIAHLQEIIDAGLPLPAANQLELHPYCQKRDILAFMAERGILPIAYSSLAPLSNWREDGRSAKRREARTELSPVTAIAARVGVSEPQLLLRYALQNGWCVLPKSVHAGRIAQNIDLFGFEIGAEDMAALDALDRDEALAFGSPEQPFDPSKAP